MKLFGKKRDIKIEFVDADTGNVFAISELPPEDLPETFAVDTTMHLGDEDWTVVSAEPMPATEFRKSGELRLVLRKVMWMDPKKILYTMPSICNYLGEIDPASSKTGEELEIHEDEWRNIELVSLDYEVDINTYLHEILRIHQEERSGIGFKRLFVREGIEFPLESAPIPAAELENVFQIVKRYTGLSYQGADGIVTRSFAFTTQGGIVFYGRQQNGGMQELCIAECNLNEKIEQDVNALEFLMAKYSLCFVDWCRVVKEIPESSKLLSHFSQVFGDEAT